MATSVEGMLVLTIFAVFLQALLVRGGVLFSTLPHSLEVSVGMNDFGSFKDSVEAGVDQLYVRWSLSTSAPGAAAAATSFKTIETKLCYAPPSQEDRGWRKTKDDLSKDKTCQFEIDKQAYTGASGNSTVWRIKKEVPGAQYFVRAYALNATGKEVAYGESTNQAKTSNIFTVVPISGRPTSLYIATICFSVFSVGSLATFFTVERRMAAAKKGK